MAAIMTAEDVVRRIAVECAYVDERGGVGIRLEPATAIVQQDGNNFAGRPGANRPVDRRNWRRCCEMLVQRWGIRFIESKPDNLTVGTPGGGGVARRWALGLT